MSKMPTMEEFAQALSELPPEFKAQIAAQAGASDEVVVDTVAIKLELVKFTCELRKHS